MEDARIEQLETRVAELTALVEQLTSTAPILQKMQATAAADSSTMLDDALLTPDVVDHGELAEDKVSSRRGMLKLAGAAAAGAVAVSVAGQAQPAAAATGGPLLIGQVNSPTAATDVTLLVAGVMGVFSASDEVFAFTPSGNPNFGGSLYGLNISTTQDASERAGVTGVGAPFVLFGSAPQVATHGVLGVASVTSVGSGVYGTSISDRVGRSAGVRARSTTGPAVQLVPVVALGAPTAGTWATGAIQPDLAGNLYYCTVGGTPGTWRNLIDTGTTFVPLTPGRVYDSRSAAPAPGTLSSGANRTVSVADRRSTTTGAVDLANFVPAGATAVAVNVTVTDTIGQGFLSVNPGGNTTVSASTINWFGSGQILANGVIAPVNAARELTVIGGGGGTTHFLLDVTGYYI